ncbi:hypothetical protein AN958_07228 [Leucoagaricus sp. SymC.cos]|nr:hypothetical protein AN958_07228 [Leucoagaricus sp. SymC.cos]
MDPIKLKGIEDWPEPKTQQHVQQFIRFYNFYPKFIKNYSEIAHPLNQLLQKKTTFQFTDEARQAFKTLNQKFYQ